MKKLAHSPVLLHKGHGLSFRWLSPTNCILSMYSGGFFQKVQRLIYIHLFPSMYSKGSVLCFFIPPLEGPMNLTAPPESVALNQLFLGLLLLQLLLSFQSVHGVLEV